MAGVWNCSGRNSVRQISVESMGVKSIGRNTADTSFLSASNFSACSGDAALLSPISRVIEASNWPYRIASTRDLGVPLMIATLFSRLPANT